MPKLQCSCPGGCGCPEGQCACGEGCTGCGPEHADGGDHREQDANEEGAEVRTVSRTHEVAVGGCCSR